MNDWIMEEEERIKELGENFRRNLSKIPPDTRKMMAIKVEKIVREEIDDPRARRSIVRERMSDDSEEID